MSWTDLLNNYYDYIYLRKSRKDLEFDNEIDILARHERQLVEMANKKGFYIPSENILREVVSGENLVNRPMMQHLLNKIENGEVKNIFCIEIERLSRGNSIDQGIITQAIIMNNVTVHTLQKTYDPKNEYDEEYFEFGLFMSRREYKTINRRLQRGKVQAIKEGKFIASVPPFGYDRIKIKGDKGYTLEPNADAETVKLIFNLCCEGYKSTQLARHLQKLGIKSSTDKAWTPAMVKNILFNPVYTGYIVTKRRHIVKKVVDDKIVISKPVNKNPQLTKGLHKAIITEEQYEKAQNFLKSLKPLKVQKKHKLKNPFVGFTFCKICGSRMYRRLNYRDHSKDYLACTNIYCNNVSARIYIVENKLIEELKKILKEQKTFLANYEKEIIKKAKDYSSEIKKIDKQLSDLDKQFTKTCELLEKGIYSVDLFETRSKSISEKKKALNELKNRLIEENKNNDTEVIRKKIPILEQCINNYYDLDMEQRNELLSVLITRIEYYKEKSVRWTKDPYDFELNIIL